jgi:protein SCO1/2
MIVLSVTGSRVLSRAWAAAPLVIAKAAQRRAVQFPVHDFTLTDQYGRNFRFEPLRGKVILVGFAYTTCPDVCPLMTAAMRQVQTSLSPAEHDAVYLLTVTTDPEIDEAKVLASYAKRYGVDLSNWAFLTGDEAMLAPVWKNFGVRVQRKARGLIDHTSLTAVIDQSGIVRFAYHGASPDPKVVLHDLRSLLHRR